MPLLLLACMVLHRVCVRITRLARVDLTLWCLKRDKRVCSECKCRCAMHCCGRDVLFAAASACYCFHSLLCEDW